MHNAVQAHVLPFILISMAQIPGYANRRMLGQRWIGILGSSSKSVSTWISRSLGIPRLTHMDNFSLLRPKLPILKSPIIHRPTYPGMMEKMENQNERNAWNERWLRQIAWWRLELEDLVNQTEALKAMIDLAVSQIKQDPPE
jgi:hypothetical protein